ncbi:DMT family transporter [Rhodocista pekingensis]|uniref:DMT family transporter n=1 Tax=Rhodocista pekingensis TaxID=201185 RepID=A0ABW2KRC3_9PROT
MPLLPAQADSPTVSIASAVGSMALAIFLFASMNAMVKALGDTYPLSQIVFFRAFFALISIWPMVRAAGGLHSLRTEHPWGHAWRCGAGVTAMACGFAAIMLLPLANAAALSFTAPLFTTVLAVLILGERVRWRRTLALVLGFCGVLVMLSPKLGLTGDAPATATTEGMVLGSVLALAGAASAALAMISIRRLSATEPSTTIVFWFMVTACVASGILLPFQFVVPDLKGLVLLVTIGLFGGVAQLLLTRAYRSAPVAVVAPFDYTAMLWATLYGYLIWDEVPETAVWIGAAIVIGSGVYITLREIRLGVSKTPPARLRGELP